MHPASQLEVSQAEVKGVSAKCSWQSQKQSEKKKDDFFSQN